MKSKFKKILILSSILLLAILSFAFLLNVKIDKNERSLINGKKYESYSNKSSYVRLANNLPQLNSSKTVYLYSESLKTELDSSIPLDSKISFNNLKTRSKPEIGDGSQANPFLVSSFENILYMLFDSSVNKNHYQLAKSFVFLLNPSDSINWIKLAGDYDNTYGVRWNGTLDGTNNSIIFKKFSADINIDTFNNWQDTMVNYSPLFRHISNIGVIRNLNIFFTKDYIIKFNFSRTNVERDRKDKVGGGLVAHMEGVFENSYAYIAGQLTATGEFEWLPDPYVTIYAGILFGYSTNEIRNNIFEFGDMSFIANGDSDGYNGIGGITGAMPRDRSKNPFSGNFLSKDVKNFNFNISDPGDNEGKIRVMV